MKNIVTRSISGLVYVALIVASILCGADWFMALCALFSLAAIQEFQRLVHSGNIDKTLSLCICTLDIAAAVALCLSSFYYSGFAPFLMGFIFAVYLSLRIVLALCDKRPEAFDSTAKSVFSVLYIGLPLAIAAYIARMADHSLLILMMFVMIWLNDTGAYCIGSLFGRHRLCQRLSPKKSWEGFYGGLAFCIATGLACGLSPVGSNCVSSSVHNPILLWIGFGIVVSLFATWGDLFESLIKRTVGVKDSGNLIPGHGGILDRIDSLLLVSPACGVYIFLTGMI